MLRRFCTARRICVARQMGQMLPGVDVSLITWKAGRGGPYWLDMYGFPSSTAACASLTAPGPPAAVAAPSLASGAEAGSAPEPGLASPVAGGV